MPPEAPGPQAGLDDWLRWQERLHPASIDMGLERVREVAVRMSLPGKAAATITVAGTNGKGSTVAFLDAMLRAAGRRVGAYTSPHLLRYNERVCIDGRAASDEELCRAFALVERSRGDTTLTYFEFGTLAALHLFREHGVEVQLLEVGLGGRLDAVNIVDADVAVITSIGMDHIDFLGSTLESIAREKAGIVRKGRTAVIGDDGAPAALREAVEAAGARPVQAGREYRVVGAADAWDYRGPAWTLGSLPLPALPGAVQVSNAAAAVAALESLAGQVPVPASAIHDGLRKARLPGRFQRVGRAILDVAHNAEAARELAANLRAAGVAPHALVIGMLAGKPVAAFLAELPAFASIHAASLPPPRGLSAGQLVRLFPAGAKASLHGSPRDAWQAASSQAPENATILVTGSFLTVAEVAGVLT